MTTWSDEPPAGAHGTGNAADPPPAGLQAVTPADWQAALRRRRQRRTCNVIRCGQPGRLYPAGFLCDRHKPGTPADDAA